jgi:hypothetical protein
MKQAVDNFDLIAPLLHWENEHEYYYVQLILRKKDGATTFGNKNNSARLIKSYSFFNLEQFLGKRIEIIEQCEKFKCRAGINLNKRHEERVTYELLRQLTDRIITKNFKGINGILNTVNGAQTSSDKVWLIDCDSEEEYEGVTMSLMDERIRPNDGPKILTTLPTYSGHHVITRRFDVQAFSKVMGEYNLTIGKHAMHIPDIHKNNPVALYYPSKEE